MSKPRTIDIAGGQVQIPDVIKISTGTLTSSAAPNADVIVYTPAGSETLYTLLTGGSVDGITNTDPNKAGVLKYKWLYHPGSFEIRKIVGILNDTTMQIDSAFGSALGGDQFYVFDHYAPRKVRVNALASVQIMWPGGSSAIPMTDNTTIEVQNIRGVDPFVVTAGDGNVNIEDPS